MAGGPEVPRDYGLLVLAVTVVNLMPALGPPTWAVLVLFLVHLQLAPVAVVLLGALSAGVGRYLLARGTGRLRDRLSPRRVASLQAAGRYLAAHRGRSLAGLGLFALSPLPSAQLFEGAGLMGVPLLPLTFAFFLGRLVSYSIYVSAAHLAARSFGDVMTDALTSPTALALQGLMLAGLVVLARVDWTRWLTDGSTPR
jgi:membrane protein YqaA with SNARE-associated domain